MIYRTYSADDFDRLYALEVLCFEPPFRFDRRTMRAFVQRAHAATWIAEEDGQMAGFAVVEWRMRKKETTAYVLTIEVASEFRRRGVGRELLSHVEESARLAGAASIWLHVEAGNAGAIRLYEAQGFGCEGRQDDFYPQGRAGLIYMKRLDDAGDSRPLAAARPRAEIRNRIARAG